MTVLQHGSAMAAHGAARGVASIMRRWYQLISSCGQLQRSIARFYNSRWSGADSMEHTEDFSMTAMCRGHSPPAALEFALLRLIAAHTRRTAQLEWGGFCTPRFFVMNGS